LEVEIQEFFISARDSCLVKQPEVFNGWEDLWTPEPVCTLRGRRKYHSLVRNGIPISLLSSP
jgi:hypothetical protein